MIRKKHFEIILKDMRTGLERVVEQRPTLRGAQSSAYEWQHLIIRAGQLGKDTIEIREKEHD